MKLFSCSGCGNRIYFENMSCTRCGAELGFFPEEMRLEALLPAGNNLWTAAGSTKTHRKCANHENHGVCNWMVPSDHPSPYCLACRLNQTIPDLNVGGNRELWAKLESAKRRLVYSLLRFGLPIPERTEQTRGLAFQFLADTAPTFSDAGRVLTGHEDGLITLNIAEADTVLREKMREEMDEPYRTLLGHFRHESGHFYWDLLVRDGPGLPGFRQVFGDERQDYGQALERHHQQGPPPGWRDRHISAYASCHPWEDWAETWAHVLHIADTLETASAFGLNPVPPDPDDAFSNPIHPDPYQTDSWDDLFHRWPPLTFALNSLNRSMGHQDAYPFVFAPAVVEKLSFVHGILCRK